MLDLEEPEAAAQGGSSGEGKGRAKGTEGQGEGPGRKVGADSRFLRCCADSSDSFDESADLLGIVRPPF
jgi:hypothetical protein